ncbi:DUF4193 domain-containing protein [Sinomonas notoginsengisoli]
MAGPPGAGGTVAGHIISSREDSKHVAADYDELRSDVKETQNSTLEAVKSVSAPDPRSVVSELDVDESGESGSMPGGEFVAEELTVQVIPQGEDEFVCQSCFLVRHRSQKALEKDGLAYCRDCEG